MNGQIVFAPNGQMVVAIDNDGVSTFEGPPECVKNYETP